MGLTSSNQNLNIEKQSTKSYSDLYSIDSSFADLEPLKQKTSHKVAKHVTSFDESIIDDLQTTDLNT